jgi:hypothetical protein
LAGEKEREEKADQHLGVALLRDVGAFLEDGLVLFPE